MSKHSRVVIVGGGHGGFQAAKSLRDRGFAGCLTIVDAGKTLPYQRPPLSKAFLKGTASFDELLFADEEFYAANDIELLLGTTVSRIDRTARSVTLSDGSTREYSHLILATGSKARKLQIPGSDCSDVYYLRERDDATSLARLLDANKQVLVVGAGFIGLEFVSVALQAGVKPTVLEFAPRVLGRAASEPISEYFHKYYLEQGATLHFGKALAEIDAPNGIVRGATDTDGVYYPADYLVVGIGVEAETELAEQSGLACENGIVVDEWLTTSDPNISAIGDCCSYPSPVVAQRTRLESVQNATDHARNVAKKITGDTSSYQEVPWFWSDQGVKKLQIAGLNYGYDQSVLRGDVASGKFSVFLYKDSQLVAVDSVDKPMDHMSARRLLMAKRNLAPADAANESFDLKKYAAQAREPLGGR